MRAAVDVIGDNAPGLAAEAVEVAAGAAGAIMDAAPDIANTAGHGAIRAVSKATDLADHELVQVAAVLSMLSEITLPGLAAEAVGVAAGAAGAIMDAAPDIANTAGHGRCELFPWQPIWQTMN